MTKYPGTYSTKKGGVQGSNLVAVVLFICCIAMAFNMILGRSDVSPTVPSNPVNGGEGSSNSSSGPDTVDIDDASFRDAIVLGQYTTVSSSEEEGRRENLRLATEAINGIVIKPGETFSFNNTVGDYEQDERYQLAPVVNEGAILYGRGGGVCQVTSALYMAALYTDLRIVERHPHTTVVDYISIGLDATVVYGHKDLRLANDSESPLMIKAESEGQTVTVSIIGQPLADGLQIKPVAELVEFHSAGTPLPNNIEWDSDLYYSTFYIVDSYREYFSHGTETDTVLLSRDIYIVLNDTTVQMPEGSTESVK